jgi:hypothetical protein
MTTGAIQETDTTQTPHGKMRAPVSSVPPGVKPPDPGPARRRAYAWALSGEFEAKLDLIGEPESEEDLQALRDYVDITIKALSRSLKKPQTETKG